MLFGILGLIAAAAFWYWRIKAVGEVASEVHDVAGRLWGKHKRRKFLGKVNDSPLEVIDDPATAAVILMNVIATEDGVQGHVAEAAIKNEVEQSMGIIDSMEILTFGKWTANHAPDSNTVILRYGKLWSENLSVKEREDLLSMISRICDLPGATNPAANKTLRQTKLRQRLELPV
jgi:hypothetical protein